MTASVRVALDGRSYDIHIGETALADSAAHLLRGIGRGKVVIVADESVWSLHGEAMHALLPDAPVVTVPPGEASKSVESFARVSEALLAHGVGRDGTVVAFGGGVVGDLAGFCAATLRRGCQFVQIPTTLLAQVDSSVGGKTAINAKAGKNLIGAFYQPQLVITHLPFLDTLTDRDMRAGYAEVIKYGALGDADFFSWLELNGPAVLGREPEALEHAIDVCCRMKAAIVADDEHERGRRALLNLGHTFGHALEGACGYSDVLRHGEAVACGIAMAFRYSARMNLCPPEHAARLEKHLSTVGLPIRPSDIQGMTTSVDEQLNYMYQDKKVDGGTLTFILVHALGEAFVARDISADDIRSFLSEELTRP